MILLVIRYLFDYNFLEGSTLSQTRKPLPRTANNLFTRKVYERFLVLQEQYISSVPFRLWKEHQGNKWYWKIVYGFPANSDTFEQPYRTLPLAFPTSYPSVPRANLLVIPEWPASQWQRRSILVDIAYISFVGENRRLPLDIWSDHSSALCDTRQIDDRSRSYIEARPLAAHVAHQARNPAK